MKSIYFAGKFNKKGGSDKSLSERLVDDYRSIILGSSKKLTYASDNLVIDNKFIYNGPFYCEQASNGDFSSTDCNVVLDSEYKSVKNSDIYFALFDDNFSVGTIVELDWAIAMDKEVVIYYKEEESEHDIKSEYWFAILNALKRSNKVKVKSFKRIEEVISDIKECKIFYEV